VSAQALGAPAGELAVAQRVQQLQALIEDARSVAAGGDLAPAGAATGSGAAIGSTAAGGDFASALQAATVADASAASAPTAAGGYAPTGAADTAYAGFQGAPEGAASGEALIQQAAARNGVEPAVLHGLIQQESGFDPSAVSGAGAAGLTQLMPGTAASLGVANPLDPAEAIEGGARYLGQLMSDFGGNTSDALAAYNAGPGAVQEYGGVPPYSETESYVTKVLGYAEAYRQSHPPAAIGELL